MGEYITPPSVPEDVYCRRLLIPNSPEWIGTVTGALMSLIYSSEWKQTTGITTEEAANRAREMFNEYLNSGNDGECGDMACCDEKIKEYRVNPTTGRPEVRYNGGDWQPDPSDPQFGILAQPPIVGEGMPSTKCDAASNALQHFEDIVNGTSSNIATASSLFTFVVAIVTVLLEVFIIIVSGGAGSPLALTIAGMIWGAAQAVFTAGQAAFDDYWTTDALDKVLCALYCNIGENGQFTENQYQAFLTDVRFELPSSPARDLVLTAITAGGAVGLSNMASYGGSADSDCSECACGDCSEYDFTTSEYDWEVYTVGGTTYGEYIPGTGFRAHWFNDSGFSYQMNGVIQKAWTGEGIGIVRVTTNFVSSNPTAEVTVTVEGVNFTETSIPAGLHTTTFNIDTGAVDDIKVTTVFYPSPTGTDYVDVVSVEICPPEV